MEKPIFSPIYTLKGHITYSDGNPYTSGQVEVYDWDVSRGELLGASALDRKGNYCIFYPEEAFRRTSAEKGGPDLYILIRSTQGEEIARSEIYYNSAKEAEINLRIEKRFTLPVSDEVFKAVYDSPASLPGRYQWVTPNDDVRKLEEILGMPAHTIGAPLWVSGDHKHCPKCKRENNWLDIVASSIEGVHRKEMIARVILGNQKFVNVEVPHAIEGVTCYACGSPVDFLRSFKCHNWAYAMPELLTVLQIMEQRG